MKLSGLQAATATSALSIAMLAVPLDGQATQSFSDRASLEAFVDGVVEANLYDDFLPGVTLSVVKDGEIVLLKGYGHARVNPERPVDPRRTLFRIGSISKTFVWTAVMQLEAQGRLSLDDPVNDHLPDDLEIPDSGFERPIRIADLMRHTPGFESAVLGHGIVLDTARIRSLHAYLRDFRPQRVHEAGDFVSYSNYGAALAGYIVARVSGMDFETYVEKNIFEPLGMGHSTFREPHGDAARAELAAPMSAELEKELAQGLEWSQGAWEAQEFEFIGHQGPAGSMSSTAQDMARYMLAHLQDGQLEGRQILDVGTARRMHQRFFSQVEGMPGVVHGFAEYPLPGLPHNFGHSGGTLHFMSNMVMVPELGLGVFVATNSKAGGGGLTFAFSLPYLLVDRYFGAEEAPPEPLADFASRAARYTGTYRTTRRSYTQLEKLLMLGYVTQVSATDDGQLLTSNSSGTTRWVEVQPTVFRQVGGESFIAFRQDEEGRITHLLESFATSERVGFFEGALWFQLVLALGALAAVGMTTGALRRRKRPIAQTELERRAGQLMAILGVVWLAFFVCAGLVTAEVLPDSDALISEFPTPLIRVALVLVIVGASLTVVSTASLVPVWRRASWPIWRRVRHSMAVLVLVALVWTFHSWNLVGFHHF